MTSPRIITEKSCEVQTKFIEEFQKRATYHDSLLFSNLCLGELNRTSIPRIFFFGLLHIHEFYYHHIYIEYQRRSTSMRICKQRKFCMKSDISFSCHFYKNVCYEYVLKVGYIDSKELILKMCLANTDILLTINYMTERCYIVFAVFLILLV